MISMIVAFDPNRLIGADNKLPWHYPQDMKNFRKITTGNDILMGRLTFESILGYQNKPLLNRYHYVASKSAEYDFEEVEVIKDIHAFVETYPTDKELFIIGGANIYNELLPYVQRIYITHVKKEYVGDSWFPSLDLSDWDAEILDETNDFKWIKYDKK